MIADADDAAWVADVVGGEVVRFEPLSGGASRTTSAVDVQLGDGTVRQVVVQRVAGGPYEGTRVTNLAREASLYRALHGSDVAVPRLLALHPDGSAMLTERIAGQNDVAAADDPTAARRLGRRLMEQLAALHAKDPASLDLDDVVIPSGPAGSALARVALWQELFDTHVRRSAPTVRFAFRWLCDHPPADPPSLSVLWGDVGPGNFLFQGDRVTALLDWEFVHVGDRHEDLAFLAMRNFLQRQGTMGEVGELWADYEEVSGTSIDVDVAAYYFLLHVTMAVTTALTQLDKTGPGRLAVPTYLHILGRHEMILAQALARQAGVEVEEPEPLDDDDAAPELEVLDALLDEATFPTAVPGFPTTQDLIAHLRARARVAPSLHAAELADLQALLGWRPATVGEGRRHVDELVVAGKLDEEDLIRWAFRTTRRRSRLWPAWAEKVAMPLPELTVASR